METENWKPDHSITKGYPYDRVISIERFVNRPNVFLNDKVRTEMHVNIEHFPNFPIKRWWHRLGILKRHFLQEMVDFQMDRLFDYHEALKVAENQILHILEEGPFLPEDFNFTKTYGPRSVMDNPTTIYTSKYNSNISIFRLTDLVWTVIERVEEGGFKQYKLNLPNHRIAYAAFFALGIQVEESKEAIDDTIPTFPFRAYFRPGGDREKEIILNEFSARDMEDAEKKAKFLFGKITGDDVAGESSNILVEEITKALQV